MSAHPSHPVGPSTPQMKVWDLPVRLFHWTLVLSMVLLFISGQVGAMPLHALLGELVLALVLFRLFWGLIGSQTARFSDFVTGPKRTIAYLQDGQSPSIGHNPLGGWMIVFLLAALACQAVLGLMSNDDVAFDGPLAGLVGSHLSGLATGLHRVLFIILAAMAAIHVGAVLFHWRIKHENLILPMFTGRKTTEADPSSRQAKAPTFVSPLKAAVLFVVVAVLLFGVLRIVSADAATLPAPDGIIITISQ